MWRTDYLTKSNTRQTFRLNENKSPLSHRQFLTLLSENQEFISWYNQILIDAPFDAYFWENKPVTQSNLNEPYECTLVRSHQLSGVNPDSSTFDAYFNQEQSVVRFPNLGGDAQLVVPCPDHQTKDSVYTQIGSFVRQAPDDQISDFWSAVGTEMLKHIQSEPRWLSTSGLGVYWLHVRIDSVPKYYQTQAYKTV